ncbi:cyclin-C [Microdochium trichocladiopsis]|uniref:RNA polymerase II holoenzyme cyclin-like subunit n=1 Tax=Microdochium trichocladiopsis TaxID=1682393 RepID=A0A9P8XWJ0_9PEZI|nr:cyclin-C [Microdochium trichocladiopsis]KAH7021216.1 cyclin-C [Microdochium trichocladiopsis]
MAANYWESTQRRYWQFTKDELAQLRENLEEEEQSLVQMFPLPQWRHLSIYFNQQLHRLAKRLNCRQQAVATAQLYIKRFYCKVEIRRTNPYLVLTTALYLACKMEECPQHIRIVVQEARTMYSDLLTVDTSRLGECEFFLISEMSSHLIVHQPYRTLTQLQTEFALSQEEISLALSVINDHYMTDLPLHYPPHIVALTAILLSLVLRPNSVSATPAAGMAAAASVLAQAQGRQQQFGMGGGGGSGIASGQTTPGAGPPPTTGGGGGMSEKEKQQGERVGKVQRFAQFLAESNVDIEGMVDCTQELISFYECHEQYNDKMTREQINRFIKARALDRP